MFFLPLLPFWWNFLAALEKNFSFMKMAYWLTTPVYWKEGVEL